MNPTRFSLRHVLILIAMISALMMVAGLLYTGANGTGSVTMLPFILAACMAPLGLGILIYWALRVLDWYERRQRGEDF